MTSLPPGLERGDQHTWTDENGNVHNVATDQYGRKWDWYRDENGTTHTGYTDEGGQWHEVRKDGDTWIDTSWDENGQERITNLGDQTQEMGPLQFGNTANLENAGEFPTPPTGGEGEEGYQTQEVPPLQFGQTGNFPTPPAGGEGEEEYGAQAPPGTTPWELQFGNTGNVQPAGEFPTPPDPTPTGGEGEEEYGSQEVSPLQFGNTANLQTAGEGGNVPTLPGDLGEPFPTEPSAPTLNQNLIDPTLPGPTLDTGLLGRIEQNPALVEALNQNEDIAWALERDPTSIEQIEQYLGLAEPSSVTGAAGGTEPAAVADPSLMEPPVPEPGPPGQDIDDVTP